MHFYLFDLRVNVSSHYIMRFRTKGCWPWNNNSIWCLYSVNDLRTFLGPSLRLDLHVWMADDKICPRQGNFQVSSKSDYRINAYPLNPLREKI